MRRNLLSLMTMTLLLVICFESGSAALTPIHVWSKRFGDTSSQTSWGVANDTSRNITMLGTFSGSVDFGGGPLTSVGGDDIYLARVDSLGNHVWSKRFGDGVSQQVPVAVASDAAGNVAITGYFYGTIDFGGGPLTSAGNEDVFIAKFDASGTHLWSKRYGDAGTFQQGTGVSLDPSGSVVVAGYFCGTIDFGGGGLACLGQVDVFLVKLDVLGDHVWSKRFGDGESQYGGAVTSDAAGNVIAIGTFRGTVDFGGGPLTTPGGGTFSMYLAKFDGSGIHVWSGKYGSATTPRAVSADASGNVIVTGSFGQQIDFGGGTLQSAGNEDVFLAKLDALGSHVWSRRFGDAESSQLGSGAASDASGNVVIAVSIQGTINFGGGALPSAGSSDIGLAKFDASGNHLWSTRFGDSNSQTPRGVVIDGTGNMVVAGSYSGIVDFGGGTLGASGSDIFVAKYGDVPSEPRILAVTDIGNDQGRQAIIRFVRSATDSSGTPITILRYEAYRRIDPAPPPALVTAPGSEEGTLLQGWVYVGDVPAHGEHEYNIVCPTIGDSTMSQGMYYSVFMIRATTSSPYLFFDSAVDSGYSVDNLSPAPPQNLMFSAGGLFWEESPEIDFDYFTVYGSASATFDGSAILIGYTSGTSFDVGGSPYAYYYVTTTDFSGNEGRSTRVQSLLDAGEKPIPRSLILHAFPIPFRSAATIRYGLPSSGRVRVAVYDARGARVALLTEEMQPAGFHVRRWETIDPRGQAVDPGVYFVQIEHAGVIRSRKIVRLD